MSGGHWGYLSLNLAETESRVAELMRLLSKIEHELDWGISGDACRECAELHVAPAIEALFDRWAGNYDGPEPEDVMDDPNIKCGKCWR